MSKLYQIKDEYQSAWKEKLEGDLFDRFTRDGFDIDEIVELSRAWDVALQRVLDQVKVIRDDA